MFKLDYISLKDSRSDLLYSFLLFIILLFPNFFVMYDFKEIEGNLTMKIAYLALSIAVWIFPLIFLRKKIYFGFDFLFYCFHH